MDNTAAVRAKNLELLAEGYDADRAQADDASAKIDYNIMMGNLDDPEEEVNE